MDQITSDHSFVNHLVMTGQITKDEAFHHPQRNIITKVMGTDKTCFSRFIYQENSFYDYLLFEL